MPSSKLKSFLDSNNVKYVSVTHSPSYTAQEIAASAHVSGKNMAKTVIIKLDGKMAMVIEPAHTRVDFESVKSFANAKDVELASESEFRDRFPECELGAMPPFGNLYNMDVYVGDELAAQKDILFNAGTHSELIKMDYQDFAQLVKPTVIPS